MSRFDFVLALTDTPNHVIPNRFVVRHLTSDRASLCCMRECHTCWKYGREPALVRSLRLRFAQRRDDMAFRMSAKGKIYVDTYIGLRNLPFRYEPVSLKPAET